MTPTRSFGARRRALAAGTAFTAGLTLLAGCTSKPAPPVYRDPGVPVGGFRLVAFDSCDDAIAGLKKAAKEYVGPYGFGGDVALYGGGPERRAAANPAAGAPGAVADGKASVGGAPGGGQPNYSGTNTHEAGVDEPDLVKTDGRRIVTVSGGVLRVVDAGARKVTGELSLKKKAQDPVRWSTADLLLHGDHALVLIRESYIGGPAIDVPPNRSGVLPPSGELIGPRLLLVDLSGQPRVLSEYRFDGGLVDARQVGGIARVVVRSAPRVHLPYREKGTDAERIATNKRLIDQSGVAAWLPRYEITTAGRTTSGMVDCGRISRPATYSGTSMVSVLTFDLAKPQLGDGDVVTVVADGDTVYSNGPSLYVANDQRWRVFTWRGGRPAGARDQATELYKFDTSQPGRPRYVASGSVKGWLINQYALSEWDGDLRVATTTGETWIANAKTSSTVYVLGQRGESLVEKGKVTGLGKGERIYSVRFVGEIGYVVTFRQTDPLYTVDLSEPSRPRVTGELKITGYSAYLHPAGDGRLIGVGQEASSQGRVQGTQVSLFDVSDLERPTRLAQHHVRSGHSEAEFDPHAFLYWPQDRLLVLPVTVFDPTAESGDRLSPASRAMILRVSDSGFSELGMVSHGNASFDDPNTAGTIRRSLVIDGVLWTVSDAGLKATGISTLEQLAWLPN